MQEIIAREELEKSLFEMALHGVKQEQLDEERNIFERQFKDKGKIKEESKLTLLKLQSIKGFKYGKKSGTKVINRM